MPISKPITKPTANYSHLISIRLTHELVV